MIEIGEINNRTLEDDRAPTRVIDTFSFVRYGGSGNVCEARSTEKDRSQNRSTTSRFEEEPVEPASRTYEDPNASIEASAPLDDKMNDNEVNWMFSIEFK